MNLSPANSAKNLHLVRCIDNYIRSGVDAIAVTLYFDRAFECGAPSLNEVRDYVKNNIVKNDGLRFYINQLTETQIDALLDFFDYHDQQVRVLLSQHRPRLVDEPSNYRQTDSPTEHKLISQQDQKPTPDSESEPQNTKSTNHPPPPLTRIDEK